MWNFCHGRTEGLSEQIAGKILRPRRDEITYDSRKLHTGELHSL